MARTMSPIFDNGATARHLVACALALLALAACPGAMAGPEMGVAQVGNSVKFVVPPNWKVAQQNDQVAMIMPETQPQGGCLLAVTPMFEDDMHDDMALAMKSAEVMLPPQLRPFGIGGISRLEGISVKGWHFIDLYGSAGDPRQGMAAHVLVAQLGTRRAVMFGLSSSKIDDNVYTMAAEPKPVCLAGQNNRLWVTIFHSLTFNGVPMDPTEFRRMLVGSWSHMGKVALSLSFDANGEFSKGGASGYVLHNVKPGYNEYNTTSLGMGGRWETPGGDQLLLHCNRGCNADIKDLVSMVRKVDPSNPGGSSWTLRTIGMPSTGDFTLDYGRDR